MTDQMRPRKTPCASCPYRLSTPSGVWAAEEYEKLPQYDEPTWNQPPEVFMCHQADGSLCSGWVACGDPTDLLALRLAVSRGDVSPEVFDYKTTIPLHPSGAAAAEYGIRDIPAPGSKARAAITKLTTQRPFERTEHGPFHAHV